MNNNDRRELGIPEYPMEPMSEGRADDIAGRFIFGVLVLAVILVAGIQLGCSTLKGDAKTLGKDIAVDGKTVATVAYVDGKAIVTLALADAQNLATNPVLQAAVAKDLITVAPLLVK